MGISTTFCAAVCLLAAAGSPGEEAPFQLFLQEHTAAFAEDAGPARGNHVAIINDSYDALLLRVHLIRTARESIDIQTFIWADDACGKIFRYELVQAMQRGVRVRVLVDHMGVRFIPKALAYLSTLSPGLEIRVYRPAALRMRPSLPLRVLEFILPTGTNQRMHVKTMVVDGRVGLTGGRNMDDHYYNNATTYNFKDRDALVVGPVVEAMAHGFEEYWEFRKSVPAEKLKDVARLIRIGVMGEPLTRVDVGLDDGFAQLDRDADDAQVVRARFIDTMLPASKVTYVIDKPGFKTFYFLPLNRTGGGRVSHALTDSFKTAEDTLIIQSPYVILNRRARRQFRKVKKQSQDLRIICSTNSFGAADHIEAYSANYRLRTKVIKGLGFEIYEYKPHPQDLLRHFPNYPEIEQRAVDLGTRRPPFLSIHAKSFVMDDDLVFVGTYNLAPRSFYINSEDGLLIEDEAIARAVKEDILRDIAPENSWVIAERRTPLVGLNNVFEGLSGLVLLDLWPIRNTTSYELLDGKDPVAPTHPDFYEHYTDIGSFPGGEDMPLEQILTSIYKTIGKAATPLL
jgi:cardiolipin synthase C